MISSHISSIHSIDNPTYNEDSTKNGTASSTQASGHPMLSSIEPTEPVYHTLEGPIESNSSTTTGHSHVSPHQYELLLHPSSMDSSNTGKPHPYTDKPRPYEIVMRQETETSPDQTAVTTHPNVSYATKVEQEVIQEMDESNTYSTLDVSMHDYAILEPHTVPVEKQRNQDDRNVEDDENYCHLNYN